MVINGRRQFTFNNRKFYVSDTVKADRKTEFENYYLNEVDKNGFLHILYDTCGWKIPKFRTIKEAQRYVRDWEFMLETLT